MLLDNGMTQTNEVPTTEVLRSLIGQDVTVTTTDGGTYTGRLTVSAEGDVAALNEDGFFGVGNSRGIIRSEIASIAAR